MTKLDTLILDGVSVDGQREFYIQQIERHNEFCQLLKEYALEEQGTTEDSKTITWLKVYRYLFEDAYAKVMKFVDQLEEVFGYCDPDGTWKEDSLAFIDALAVFVEDLDDSVEELWLTQMQEDGMGSEDTE